MYGATGWTAGSLTLAADWPASRADVAIPAATTIASVSRTIRLADDRWGGVHPGRTRL